MGKRLVISTKKREYMNFKYTGSLQNIDWDDVEALIYNSSKENDVEALLEISKAVKIVPICIYINDDINSLYYGLFSGVDGDIYNDEDMLNDEDVLEFLVSDYKKTGMTIKTPNADVETLSKFISNVSAESAEALSKVVQNSMVMKTLEGSVQSLETSLVRTNQANQDMVVMFNKTSEIIDVLKNAQQKTTEEIEKLSSFMTEMDMANKNRTNDIYIFPTFNVPNSVSKVLYIQVYSPCRYLLSFISFYQHYLKYQKQIDTKLLVAMPNLKKFIKKYEAFTRLAPETINTKGIDKFDSYITYEPNDKVLTEFFNMKTQMFIVVDMLFGQPLLKGAKVNALSAVGALSDIKKFGLDAGKTIISTYGTANSIIIPRIQNYGYITSDTRGTTVEPIMSKRTKYFEACKDKGYAKLDKILGYI